MRLFSWLKTSPLDPLKLPARARIRDEWLDHDLETKAAAVRAKYGLGDPKAVLGSLGTSPIWRQERPKENGPAEEAAN